MADLSRTSLDRPPNVLVDRGFLFGESPRWHDGRLWFSDLMRRRVMTVTLAGELAVAAEFDDLTSGLGFLPDGSLLVVQVTKRVILRISGGKTSVHADTGAVARVNLNDMVVDTAGRAYVSPNTMDSPDMFAAPATPLLLVTPDGVVREVGEPLLLPNGMTISADGRVLTVCETAARRVSAFDIAADGTLGNRRTVIDLGETQMPDGAAQDTSGTWIATLMGHEFVRIDADGQIIDRISTGDREAIACTLGGPDGRTLFALTCQMNFPRMLEIFLEGQPATDADDFSARIETHVVEHPHAGAP